MEIGKRIKAYRIEKKVKQEELAEYLGVSYQAVSKWENEASVPDISLLPKLAVYFGVTIDELFRTPDEAQFERIENSVLMEHEIEDNTFRYFESFLKEMTGKKEWEERAFTDLALLYNHRASAAHKKASGFAKRALEFNPDSHAAWAWFLEAENGVCGDEWYDNHFEVTSFCKEFLEKHPGNFRALYAVIENLLADSEFDEALRYVEQLEKNCPENRTHMPYQYRGDIAFGKGDVETALSYWKKSTETEPKQWRAFCNMGDNLKKLGRFEEAISYYEECFAMQEAPRFNDGLHSIAQLCERMGQFDRAIEARERILNHLKEEYGVDKGVEVERQKKEIQRLAGEIKEWKREL